MALIHWWPLTENTDDCIDSSHTQTVTALPWNLKDEGVPKRAGKVSINTFDFNGSNTLIDTGVNESSLGNNFTISAWLLADSNPNYRGAIGQHNNWGSDTGGFLFGQFVGGNLLFSLCSKDPSSGNFVEDGGINTSLPLNTWTHFTMVVKEGRTIQVYKNGELVGTNSANIKWNPIRTIIIGKAYNSSERYWDGAIQDIRIYDEPLSPKEVKKISQGLILHYNPDYAIRSSCWTGEYDYYWVDNVPKLTQSIISDSSLPSGEYKKFTWTATGSYGGPLFDNIGPSIDGATYTTSFYWKSKGYKPNIRVENYTSIKIYTTLAPNGWWYTQIVGTYNASARYVVTTFYDNPPNGTACEVDVSSVKVEPGDFATPYRRDNKSYIPDSSGFGHDGTIISEAIEKSTDHRYKKNIVADGNWEHHIQSNINPSFLTSGVTFNVWHKNITKKDFLLANGQGHDFFLMAMDDTGKWSSNVDGEQIYYIDGNPSAGADGHPKDGQWHMYTFVCHGISKWTELYWSRHAGSDGNSWTYNGPLGDIRLYATALSAADVKALYNETRVTRPMQFLISNSSALSSMTSSNPVLADGELVVVRSTDGGGKTYFNIRKGNGVNNFNSLPWKQVSEAILKGWRSSFVSDAGSLVADKGSYSNLKQNI